MRPFTSKIKGYPFEVLLPDGCSVSGVLLADQPKSLDWRTRKAKFIERISSDTIALVTARVLTLKNLTPLPRSNTALHVSRHRMAIFITQYTLRPLDCKR